MLPAVAISFCSIPIFLLFVLPYYDGLVFLLQAYKFRFQRGKLLELEETPLYNNIGFYNLLFATQLE